MRAYICIDWTGGQGTVTPDASVDVITCGRETSPGCERECVPARRVGTRDLATEHGVTPHDVTPWSCRPAWLDPQIV